MIRRLAAVSVLLVALSACTPPMPVAYMLPDPEIVKSIEPNRAFNRNISLGEMRVSDDVQHNGIATISPEILRKTLDEALYCAHMLGHEETIQKDASAYILSADLSQLDTTMASLGFSNDAASTINYTLTRRADERVLYHDNIHMTAHAGWIDAPDGIARRRLVMAKAMKENVTHLLRVLAQIEVPPLPVKH